MGVSQKLLADINCINWSTYLLFKIAPKSSAVCFCLHVADTWGCIIKINQLIPFVICLHLKVLAPLRKKMYLSFSSTSNGSPDPKSGHLKKYLQSGYSCVFENLTFSAP